MATIELLGRITEQGRLEIELPVGLPAGEARITIEIPTPDWTTEEIAEALKVQPRTGAEILAAGLTGGWQEEIAESGAEWVERRRRERQERRHR
jgi:hypothetical protein